MSRGDWSFDELALLLTDGRLCERNRAVMAEAFDGVLARGGDAAAALTMASTLLFATPEFHTQVRNDVPLKNPTF